MNDFVYHVIAFEKTGKIHCLAGSFINKNDAIKAILHSGPHEVWEWYFRYICIEKYRLNSMGHPAICGKGNSEEILWFEWKCDEPFEQTQTGKYVQCEQPEWAEHTCSFI